MDIPLKPRSFALAVAITSLGFVVVQLDISVVNIALMRIGLSFGAGVAGLQWVVDGYALAFASLLMSAGALGDRIGARRIFAVGMALFTLASLACGLAQGMATLIAARVGQGVGAAMLMPCSLVLLNHASGGNASLRATGVSIWTAAGGAALAAGPALGGFMIDSLGWRSIFLINLPIGVFAILLGLRFLQETPRKPEGAPLDLPGQVLAILAPLALTVAFIEGGVRGFASPLVMAAFLVAAVTGAAFIAVERRSTAPLLPLGLFADPAFAVANFVGLAINLTTYGMIFVSFYFQQTKGYSPAVAGAAFTPFLAMVILSNMAAGPVVARKGVKLPMIVGLCIGALGYALLFSVDADTSYASLMWRLFVMTVGSGLAVPAMTTAVLASAPPGMEGVASGVLNSIRQTSGAIGVALFGALMTFGIVPGMRIAFTASAVLMLLGAGAAMLFMRPAWHPDT
ncbi:MFS transporter [Mesorhizobium sp. Root554]|nr:MFS transporter [Mesorhizobium sp. Root1471]KQZ35586.1 MFS transporter [Mesorhizobium sp. Root554]